MLNFLNDLLWGKVLIIVLIAVGLLFTVAARFVQFRYFGTMFSILGQSTRREEGHLSSFQALVFSVAGRVGAGNIAFPSMIYTYYLGENSLSFFSDNDRWLLNGCRVLTLALIVWGASQDLTTVFGFADVTMGFLALVNLFAPVMLFKVGLRVMQDYDRQIQAGIAEPVFEASQLPGVDLDTQAWPNALIPEETIHY